MRWTLFVTSTPAEELAFLGGMLVACCIFVVIQFVFLWWDHHRARHPRHPSSLL